MEDLKQVAKDRQIRIRDTEIKIQRVRNLLKDPGTPGLSLAADHYRLKTLLDEVRKILDIQVDPVGGQVLNG